MKTIRVAVYRTGMEMAIEEIPAGLESYQEIVGGYIAHVPLMIDDLVLICNEEGIPLGLSPNRVHRWPNGETEMIRGDFFVCRVLDDDYAGLTDDDIGRLPALIG